MQRGPIASHLPLISHAGSILQGQHVPFLTAAVKELPQRSKGILHPLGGLFPQVSISAPGTKREEITPKVIRGSKTPGCTSTAYVQK